MKTIRYTTALLITMIFTVLAAYGQSARRQASVEKREHPAAKAVQPARQARRTHVQQQPAAHRNAGTALHTRKHVSISTRDNPRSQYRRADYRVYTNHTYHNGTRANKYTTRRYYSGNYYHYAYPSRKVKFHYHHDTYVHHYHVLYYPTYTNIYWTRNMYRDYRRWYPEYHWRYNYGYRINTISVFDARYNLGEVAMVYGRVYASWYNRDTDDYLLFFGGDFPHQEFTVVLPGHVARRFNWRPERYFLGEHVTVTGLITTFDGIPEIIVKNRRQIERY